MLVNLLWTILACFVLKFGGFITASTRDVAFYATLCVAGPVGLYWTFRIFRALGRAVGYSIMMGGICALPTAAAVSLTAYSVQHDARMEILEAKGLNQHLPEYLSPPIGNSTAPRLGLKGKYAIVNLDKQAFSDLQFNLPEEFQPASAVEVRWIAQLSYGKFVVGHYTDGGEAEQWYMDVAIIDARSHECVQRRRLLGSEPPKTSRTRGGETGGKPAEVLFTLLAELSK